MNIGGGGGGVLAKEICSAAKIRKFELHDSDFYTTLQMYIFRCMMKRQYCIRSKLIHMLKNTSFFWDLTPYILVEIYWFFEKRDSITYLMFRVFKIWGSN
jgi:hypothetical protein